MSFLLKVIHFPFFSQKAHCEQEINYLKKCVYNVYVCALSLLTALQGRKKTRSDYPGQLNIVLGQVKIEVQWSGGKVKYTVLLALVVS